MRIYSDRSSQGLHLSPFYGKGLICPGDVEVQPLFLDLPQAPDACARLATNADGSVAVMLSATPWAELAVLQNGAAVVDVPSDGAAALDAEGGAADASAMLSLSPEGSVTASLAGDPSAELDVLPGGAGAADVPSSNGVTLDVAGGAAADLDVPKGAAATVDVQKC